MSRVVRKYGGSSLREPDQIRAVARHIAALRGEGLDVVVVVSAMAATTDEFIALARALHPDPPKREMDMLLSVGERVSCSLLSMALDAENVPAVSYTGSQVGIITDTHHGEARIVDVRPARLLDALEKGFVVVVAGFQGVSVQKEITTLGRGGSDATAIALAAAIGAERCELMKDVDGIFSADPHAVDGATLLREVDYDDALALAQGGSKVLQSEAARLAREQQVPLRIGRTSTNEVGTIVTDKPMQRPRVIGLATTSGLRELRGGSEDAPPDRAERLVSTRNGWVAWVAGEGPDRGEYAGITLVLSDVAPPGLHRAVHMALHPANIRVLGAVSSERDLWLCVPAAQVRDAVRLVHEVVESHGWMTTGPGTESEPAGGHDEID